jgi:uncharacterized protein with NRDE domain
MCLLIAISRVHPGEPLVLAANRDEWLARPAEAMTVLRASGPRTLGGRDLLAGGTWLAVNEHGVVAALTNRPTLAGRDPARRSRGELPVLLSSFARARDAADHAAAALRAEWFNPCWMFVADRDELFYLDLTGEGAVVPAPLPPGVHVLENNPCGAASPKERWSAAAVAPHRTWSGEALYEALFRVLGSHEVPDLSQLSAQPSDGFARLPETHAACVHAGPYGTRWSAVIRVAAARDTRPALRYVEGTPCVGTVHDASALWRSAP